MTNPTPVDPKLGDPKPGEITGRPSKRLLAGLAAAMLLLAAVLYALFGTPSALQQPAPAPSPPPVIDAHGNPQIEAMVAGLAERLKAEPGDVEGWSMLGRSYLVLGKPAEAVDALRKRLALEPKSALALADLADARALQQGRRFDGEPEQLLRQALQADPRQPKALELAGTMAFDRGEFKAAVSHWSLAAEVLQAAEPNSRTALNLHAGIEEAQRRGGLSPPPAALAATAGATAGARVSGRIELAPALAASVQPGDTVMVFARVVDGPRMPVAVLRKPAGAWPMSFTLDESTAMNPGLKLSPSMQVVVGVRIGKSGQAAAQPGDLQGFSEPVPVGTQGLRIEVNQRVP
jgi:cytochrome c-type biogenesis protein CcmH